MKKTERLELRLAPWLLNRIDAWNTLYGRGDSRAEAFRRLCEIGLGDIPHKYYADLEPESPTEASKRVQDMRNMMEINDRLISASNTLDAVLQYLVAITPPLQVKLGLGVDPVYSGLTLTLEDRIKAAEAFVNSLPRDAKERLGPKSTPDEFDAIT